MGLAWDFGIYLGFWDLCGILGFIWDFENIDFFDYGIQEGIF